jgi:hypothetical protein
MAWPPGWKPFTPYPEEATFVAPQATTKVAPEVRTLSSDVRDEKKFKGGVISPRILIDNPYLDPNDPFFNIPRQIACLPDGSVAVASTAKRHKDGRSAGTPYASGIWRIRPDGTARRVLLGVKLGKAAVRVDGIGGLTLDAKGTIYFGASIGASGGGYQVMRLNEAKGTPEVVAGAPRPTDVNQGDGPARQAHFGTIRSMCFSPDGTLYINDANHVIRKMTPAGHVTTWAF